MKSSYTILIQPGLGNSGEFHWQTLWESMFPFARRIKQREWFNPESADWITEIEKSVAKYESGKVFIVAHSLGCLALAQWALKTNRTIAGALLVAPPDALRVENTRLATGFYPLPQLKLPFKSIVVASSNDPYADIRVARQYADAWGSLFINIGEKGHINAESNIGFWPEGLKILHTLTNKKQILSYA
jgi:uncharacterized protein